MRMPGEITGDAEPLTGDADPQTGAAYPLTGHVTSVAQRPRQPGLAHQGLVYANAEEYLARAVPFLRSAVERGEQALAIHTPGQLEQLRDALGADSAEVEFVDAHDWYQVPAWTLAAYHRYLNRHGDGARRVWILTEPVWSGRSAEQTLEWQCCESILNVAFAHRAASVVCAYDSRALAPDVVASAGQTHPVLRGRGEVSRSPSYVVPADYTARHRAAPRAAPPDAMALTFGLAELAAVRHASADWARRVGLPEDLVRELLIAVHEVVSNAVEHGGGHGTARLWTTGDEIVCEVTSPAPLHHPFPGYLPPDARQERGRGLWMARQICSRVDVYAGDDGVRVQLSLPGC